MTALTEDFIALGYRQGDLCRRNADAWVSCLVKFGSQRTVMRNVYHALVMSGRLLRIEDAPVETKREFWDQAVKDCAGTLEVEKVKIVAKALYAMAYLLQNS